METEVFETESKGKVMIVLRVRGDSSGIKKNIYFTAVKGKVPWTGNTFTDTSPWS